MGDTFLGNKTGSEANISHCFQVSSIVSSSPPSNFAPIRSPRVWYMAASRAVAWLHSLDRIRDTGRSPGQEGQWACPGLAPVTLRLDFSFVLFSLLCSYFTSYTPSWIKAFSFEPSANDIYVVDTYLGVLPVFSFASPFSTDHFLLCVPRVPGRNANITMITFLFVLSSQFLPPHPRLWSPWRKKLDFTS